MHEYDTSMIYIESACCVYSWKSDSIMTGLQNIIWPERRMKYKVWLIDH